MPARKVKVSVTLSDDLLSRIDRKSARSGSNRSTLIEHWLRFAARHEVQKELDDATVNYYDNLTPLEVAEETKLSRALSSAAKKVKIDDRPVRVPRRGPSR